MNNCARSFQQRLFGLRICANMSVEIIGRRSLPKVEGALLHHESRPENFRRTFELDPSSTRTKSAQRSSKAL
jgi:hypothetical protein